MPSTIDFDHSGCIDDRPEVIRIVGRGPDGRANPIVFRQGTVDFSPWSQGELDGRGCAKLMTGTAEKVSHRITRAAIEYS